MQQSLKVGWGLAVTLLLPCISAVAAPAQPTRIAVLGLHFDNTSPEATRPDEVARIALINQQLLRPYYSGAAIAAPKIV